MKGAPVRKYKESICANCGKSIRHRTDYSAGFRVCSKACQNKCMSKWAPSVPDTCNSVIPDNDVEKAATIWATITIKKFSDSPWIDETESAFPFSPKVMWSFIEAAKRVAAMNGKSMIDLSFRMEPTRAIITSTRRRE